MIIDKHFEVQNIIQGQNHGKRILAEWCGKAKFTVFSDKHGLAHFCVG